MLTNLQYNDILALTIANRNQLMVRGHDIADFQNLTWTRSVGGYYHQNVSVVPFVSHIFTYWPKSNYLNYSWGFSGCAMAQFTYNNHTYICHIPLENGGIFDPRTIAGHNNWRILKGIVRFRNIFFPFTTPEIENFMRDTIIRNGYNDPYSLDCIGIIQGDDCYTMIFDHNQQTFIFVRKWRLMQPDIQYIYNQHGNKIYTQL